MVKKRGMNTNGGEKDYGINDTVAYPGKSEKRSALLFILVAPAFGGLQYGKKRRSREWL